MVHYVAGSLYPSITTNGGAGQPANILYQVQPFINSSTGKITSARILNEVIHGGGSTAFYYPHQIPDQEGNVTEVFNFSSSSAYASLAYASRRAGQPTGGIPDAGFVLQSGQGPYTEGRWGDYVAGAPAGISAILATTTPVAWFAGMYAGTSNKWGTAIGRNGYTVRSDP